MSASHCDRCGAALPPDQLVTIAGQTVCARCKAGLVMDVKSGVSTAGVVTPEEAEEIRRRIRKFNLLSFAFALPGLGMQFGANALIGPAATPEELTAKAATALLIQLVGVALLMVGLGFYAKMRGRSPLFALLGLLSCIGLLILYFIPKRCQHCAASASYRKTQCASCGAPV